ncbi:MULTISPECIES: 4'-phosphopantetheinyl transferase superfamily protein [Rhizobium/Agrobacterium group]|uniref:4'-phosphopantetheinyl transferase superfamily protein n=1 Tax=Rhizobium/Agrobacterium group TaxID=227290 RepID=UPI0018D25371
MLIEAPELLSEYAALLSEEECARAERFHFPCDRHQFLVARALLRTTLSHYYPAISPRNWQFAKNPYGRPYVIGQMNEKIGFNLSHTQGLIALAIASVNVVGVDVEKYEKAAASLDIAERFFTRAEVRYLLEAPPEFLHRRFFEVWTLKEAYIKARGMGLSIPLEGFTIGFPSETTLSISFARQLGDDPLRWRLWTIEPGADTLLALALASDRHWNVRLFDCIPLLEMTETKCTILRQL